MEKFIRLDVKGEWRGVDHRSSVGGLGDEGAEWEDGISCYSLRDLPYAIEQLRRYWADIACMEPSDFGEFQVTIFEGERIGEGADYEDIATCERTLLGAEAAPFMKKVYESYQLFDYEEISEEEYQEGLVEAYRGLIA